MKMVLPTAAQIAAGNAVAEELIDASLRFYMCGLGGCKDFKLKDFNHQELVKAHVLDKKIDSVTAIWIAMQEAGQ
jgi:hypothetical protein